MILPGADVVRLVQGFGGIIADVAVIAVYAEGMASLTIRNLDDPLKGRLRVQAAMNGRSMEAEARDILRTALPADSPRPGSLYESIRARVAVSGGFDLELPPREPMRDPPTFD